MIIIIINITLAADGGRLFFVSGVPSPDLINTYQTCLYRFDLIQKNLFLIREIASKNEGTFCIISNYDDRILLIAYPAPVNPAYFAVIDMDKPLENKILKFNYNDLKSPDYSLLESHLYNLNDKLSIINVFGNGKVYKYFIGAINDSNKRFIDIHDLSVLSDIRVDGSPGPWVPGDTFYIFSDEKRNLFVYGDISHEPKKFVKIYLGLKLPNGVKYNKNNIIVAWINNKNMLALSVSEDETTKSCKNEYTIYYVFNKLNKEWREVHFKGANTQIRGFGRWIVGVVNNINSIDKKNDIKFVDKNKNSNKAINNTIALYDIINKKMYNIKANDADSEVLLVENDAVYYRLHDKIYKAKILKEFIGPSHLLIKSDQVPNIHWAFIQK